MKLNIIHRPAVGENHPYYRLQQKYAHELNLKVTLMITPEIMEDSDQVAEILEDHKKYGDELGLWLWRFEGRTPFWLLNRQSKEDVVKDAVKLFENKFGFSPVSVGSYLLDASSIQVLKELCPTVETIIAGCFEEGTKVFHGCNNSWYLFSEGMPWGPWYPSTGHSFKPANDESDWTGLVAVPHLNRDLALSYEGRNDFFASHPANVQRGMGNDGLMHEYDYNLIDQFRMQGDFNDEFSYYQVHVGPAWIGYNPNVQDPPEVSQQIYFEQLQYLAELRNQGSVDDMYLSEFGRWYKDNIPIGKANVALAKEMLYGSGKHYFWYVDPYLRVLIDATQGGSIGDLRPYVSDFYSFTGADSPHREMATYPYLIQSQLRTGTMHHSSDGARTTLNISHNGEAVDLCHYISKIEEVERTENKVKIELTPVEIKFEDELTAKLKTIYYFNGKGEVIIKRILIDISDPDVVLNVQEYFKGCYGFTEYPEDLNDIVLRAAGKETEEIKYKYNSRNFTVEKGEIVSANIPQINSYVALENINKLPCLAEISEGNLFNPYYTLKLNYKLSQNNREVETCLKIRKA